MNQVATNLVGAHVHIMVKGKEEDGSDNYAAQGTIAAVYYGGAGLTMLVAVGDQPKSYRCNPTLKLVEVPWYNIVEVTYP